MKTANSGKPMIDEPAKSNATLIVVIVLAVLAMPLLLGGIAVVGTWVLFRASSSSMGEPQIAIVSAEKDSSQLSSDEFETRLEAARNIQDNVERDLALADLAKDAATAGNAKISQDAIGAVQGNEVRESALAESAALLAKAGKAKEGMRLAQMISDTKLRDEALGKIAKGE